MLSFLLIDAAIISTISGVIIFLLISHQKRLLQDVLEASPVAIAITKNDIKKGLTYIAVNSQWVKLYRLTKTPKELKGESHYKAMGDSLTQEWRNHYKQCAKGKSFHSQEEGDSFNVKGKLIRLVWGVIPYFQLGKVTSIIMTAKDITEEVETRKRLETIAFYDGLTKILNREGLKQAFESFKKDSGQLYLYLLDIDKFNTANSQWGIDFGDKVLVSMADILTDTGIFLARVGGDEFAIINSFTSSKEAYSFADSLVRQCQRTVIKGEEGLFYPSVSIGGCRIKGDSYDEAFRIASYALFTAKKRGNNALLLWESNEIITKKKKAFYWFNKIKFALDSAQEQLTLYYQEIKHFETGEILYHEVLLRYIDEEGKVISAGAFIDSTKNFLSYDVDKFVVNKVLRKGDFNNHPVSINLSPNSLTDPEFLGFLERVVNSCSRTPESIYIEVTEDDLQAHDLEPPLRFITENLGLNLALDDFGKGYSNLSRLTKILPLVSVIKIDRDFIKKLDDPFSILVINFLSGIQQIHNIKIIAEFVDSQNDIEKLLALEIKWGQGFFLHKPSPIIKENE